MYRVLNLVCVFQGTRRQSVGYDPGRSCQVDISTGAVRLLLLLLLLLVLILKLQIFFFNI